MKQGITRRGFLIRIGVLGTLSVVAGKGFFNSRDLGTITLDVSIPRLPSAFDGMRVGQITDIHAGPLVPEELIQKGVALVMAGRPDMIVLTGDFVTAATKFLWTTYGGFKQHHLDGCIMALAELKAPFGVYGVLGNHDLWSGEKVAERIVRALEGIGVNVLRNRAVPLQRENQGFYLVGVDDYWESCYNLSKALKGVPENACRILLSHNPDVNEDIERSRYLLDFIIAGHTHGGQIVLPFIGAPYLPSPFGQKYRAGLVTDGNRKTYVSRGLGLFFVPIRLNCPPDVTILTMHSGDDAFPASRSHPVRGV